MITDFVLDVSMVLSWCFPSEASPKTQEILDWLVDGACAYVPTIWHLEIANSLVMSERRHRIQQAESMRFISLLKTLNIKTDNQTESQAGLLTTELAREHNLTAYDASYLELALRRGLSLASKDSALLNAAKNVGLATLPQ